MLWRLARRRPVRGVAADVLNQVSYLAVVALCLAVTVFSATSVGRHLGLVRSNPLQALATTRDPTQGLDQAAKAESGIAPLKVAGPQVDLTPAAQPAAVDIGVIPVPSPSDLARPLHNGTWLPILMYHYVRDVQPNDRLGWNLSVTPDNFRKQVRYLTDHGYTTLTMRDADLVLAGKREMPLRAVVLTFDDGYRDFYTTAAPILRDAGFTATNYVPTQLVGTGNYMNWRQIEELDAEGFEMAAHSQFHVDVTTAGSNRARLEVFGAKADLESHLGHPVVDWAYPYGAVNVQAAALVREAGYWSGATTDPGSWHSPGQLLYLTRVRMGGTAELDAMVAGITRPLPVLPQLPLQ